MMTRKFQRTVEDFVCENCGYRVTGSGYTNHCPSCLWSKHVDVQPGDRAEDCGGLMQPVRVENKTGKHRLLHRCEKCRIEKWNKVAMEDNFEALIQITMQRSTG